VHHQRHFHGRGRIHFRGPFPNRLDLLERLENYRRDLEQELADVSDVIEHLRDREQQQAQAQPEPEQQA
jgi:hypothetical protein